jgi:hypothetical protein
MNRRYPAELSAHGASLNFFLALSPESLSPCERGSLDFARAPTASRPAQNPIECPPLAVAALSGAITQGADAIAPTPDRSAATSDAFARFQTPLQRVKPPLRELDLSLLQPKLTLRQMTAAPRDAKLLLLQKSPHCNNFTPLCERRRCRCYR